MDKAYKLLETVIKFIAAYFFAKLTANERNNHILIGSEYGDFIDDNAGALNDYVSSLEGTNVYLILNNPQRPNHLRRGSFQAYIKYFSATSVFYSHSFSDILPFAHRVPALVNSTKKPKRIFIQHGMLGLKSVVSKDISIKKYVLSQAKVFDKIVVSSVKEKELVMDFGVTQEKIALTGLPRFDKLTNNNFGKKQVLVFLTWSSDSQSYQAKLEALKSTQGYRLLEDAGYRIMVEEHPMLRRKKSGKIISDSISNAIMDASLLITDDSSVAWDFFYLSKEVIFWQPSNNWLLNEESFLLARIAKREAQLLDLVEKFLSGGNIKDSDYFAFYDANNAKRVFALSEYRFAE